MITDSPGCIKPGYHLLQCKVSNAKGSGRYTHGAKSVEDATELCKFQVAGNVISSVDINQRVGDPNSFLGDNAVVLARSNRERPAPPRHRRLRRPPPRRRADVASMASIGRRYDGIEVDAI